MDKSKKSKEFKESDIFCQQFLNLLIIIKFQREFMYKIEKWYYSFEKRVSSNHNNRFLKKNKTKEH
jgi:hypothetical protein